jgi:hypothetical protein
LIVEPLKAIDAATVEVSVREIGLEFDRFGRISDGLLIQSLAAKCDAAVIVGHGEIGLEFDRLGEIGDGLAGEPLGEYALGKTEA